MYILVYFFLFFMYILIFFYQQFRNKFKIKERINLFKLKYLDIFAFTLVDTDWFCHFCKSSFVFFVYFIFVER